MVLERDVRRHVDGKVQFGFGCAERVAIVGWATRVEVGAAVAIGLGHAGQDGVTVVRDLQHSNRAGQLGSPQSHAVNLDVVGMAVAAVPVVGDQHVGPFGPQHMDETGRGGVDVGSPEAVGPLILFPAGHPRIVIAEPLQTVNTEDRRRPLGLGATAVDERLAGGKVVGRLAELPVRGDHVHDPVSLGGGPGHRSARRQCLVVGMGVEEDDGSHGPIVAPGALC